MNKERAGGFTKPRPPRWKYYTPLVGLVLLAWILSGIDLRSMRDSILALSPRTLGLAAGCFATNVLIKSFRWHRMLQAQGIRLPLRISLAAYLNGQFYGQVTLGHVGEFYRAEALIERGVSVGLAMSSCLIDRFIDVLIVLAVAMVLGALVVGNVQAALWAAGLLGLGISLVAFVWAAAAYRLLPQSVVSTATRAVDRMRRNRFLDRGIDAVLDLLQGSRALLHPLPLLEALCWSTLAWPLYFCTLWVLADGMGMKLDFVILTAASSLGALSSLVPITFAGLGVREVVFAEVLALRGATRASAVALSLTNFAVMMTTALGVGIVGVIWRQKQIATGTNLR